MGHHDTWGLAVIGLAAVGNDKGYVRGYDVKTGKRLWIFHTIPRPGQFGYDTWPEGAWKTVGGANNWGEQSIDEKRGIAYAGALRAVRDQGLWFKSVAGASAGAVTATVMSGA